MNNENIGCIRLAELDDAPYIFAIYQELDPFSHSLSRYNNINLADVVNWIEAADERHPLLVMTSADFNSLTFKGGGRKDIDSEYSEQIPEDVILGWCSVERFYGLPAFDSACEVSFYVSKKYQRLGVASAFSNYLSDQRSLLDFTHLVAYVYEDNERSLRFLKKQAFEEWGKLPNIARTGSQSQSVYLLGKEFL